MSRNQSQLKSFMKISFGHILSLAVALFSPKVFGAVPPTIDCSGDQVLECTSINGAKGIVGATVQDADGDGLMVVWAINGHSARTNILASGGTTNATTLYLTNQFGFGTNDVSVGVTDDGTNIVMCSSMVVVADTTPPTIRSIIATPNQLWPPNHKMRPIRVVVRATDVCGPVRWHIADITSNEAPDGLGDGHTSPDWLIDGPQKALLRAERSGRGSGRIYTLNIEVTDAARNSTNGTVRVFVPHNRGHGRPWHDVDDDDGGPSQPAGPVHQVKPKKGKGHGRGAN